ncbi:hypothetical protein HPB52_024840 [Rhipicephalus sanguineus]|uniref:Uncharacterized protein n=1 Tax=Rhipicephalus sanguineus TaxID=34632 RepID=A0A9D4TDR2_RHISA|nr:hypothetical protein HPB52_024840 [Rhipicephalus sanguineus]
MSLVAAPCPPAEHGRDTGTQQYARVRRHSAHGGPLEKNRRLGASFLSLSAHTESGSGRPVELYLVVRPPKNAASESRLEARYSELCQYIAVAKKIVATTVALVTDPVSPTPEIVKTIPLFISWNLDDIVLLVCLFVKKLQ